MENNHSSEETVPVSLAPQNKQIKNLTEAYVSQFGSNPDYFVQVPGRVNLIGEHIDYCGYPVLPMAIEQNITIAVGKTVKPLFEIRNTNGKYEDVDIKLSSLSNENFKVDANGRPYWYNYVLCGIKGGKEHLAKMFNCGLRMVIDGNIPPASGLSSSSALVSASCLAVLFSQDVVPNKNEIASLCARCERYIGTEGGGMDQAIAFLANKGYAQFITWNPLKATPVNLPDEASFVVAHSLAEANKAATNDFNSRVIECRLAAKIIAKMSDIVTDLPLTLSIVQEFLGSSLDQMSSIVKKCLPKIMYSRSDVCEILSITDDELTANVLTENTKHLKTFKLQQRALHVYSEALRVHSFRKICSELEERTPQNINGSSKTNGYFNGSTNYKHNIEDLGMLMRESHESLKKLYECSHTNLDKLVEISDKFGAWCRLTGAGWGGCVVAICHKSQVEEYIQTLNKNFYSVLLNAEKSQVFATQPSQGAQIFTF